MNVYYEIHVDARKVNIEKNCTLNHHQKINNKELNSFHRKCLWRILKIHWTDFKSKTVWKNTNDPNSKNNPREKLEMDIPCTPVQTSELFWHRLWKEREIRKGQRTSGSGKLKREKENWVPQLEEIAGCWQQPS